MAGPVYAPVNTIMLYLTEDCNLRCTYCFVDKKPRRMTAETARKAVDYFLSRNISGALSRLEICFFGGEPFMELDLMEHIIAYARRQGPNQYKDISFCATTNGTVANARVEHIIRDAGMRLLVSMDGGPSATEHRPFVSGHSSYPVVARNLPRLAQWATETVVRMTFHPDALDLVGNLRAVLALGAPSIALCAVEEARWQGHEDELEAAYQALADWFIAEARGGYILPLEITHSMLRQWHAYHRGGKRQERACGVGHTLLGIDPDGNVMPCHRFLYRKRDWLGHVNQPELSPQRERYVSLRSADILGCDTCVAQPVCGGGCRLVALQAGYDMATGAHPSYCIVTRAHARATRRIYDTLMGEDNPALQAALASQRPFQPAFAELINR